MAGGEEVLGRKHGRNGEPMFLFVFFFMMPRLSNLSCQYVGGKLLPGLLEAQGP